jgi:hypothetical protein
MNLLHAFLRNVGICTIKKRLVYLELHKASTALSRQRIAEKLRILRSMAQCAGFPK